MNDELMYSLEPLEEGKVPKARILLKLIEGKWQITEAEVKYDPDWVDPEIMETETYMQEDKDEFYDYVIRCKACSTAFIAYSDDYKKVMNYCPGCGKKLT